MGLAFSHGKAQWSYSGFHEYREKLAKEINIDLTSMVGFGGKKSWDSMNEDLSILLNHSDSDGDLTYEQMKKIIPRLEAITKNWDDEDWDKTRTQYLIKGMKLAMRKKEKFLFR